MNGKLLFSLTIFLSIIVAVAISAKPVAAAYADGSGSSGGFSLEELKNWAMKFVLEPLGNLVFGFLNMLRDMIVNAFSGIINSMVQVITYPLHLIMNSWNYALTTLKVYLGPFGFLAPLILIGIFAGFVLVIWYVIKVILPVI